jgi:cell division protein FtsI/penicillin-binding protein 2
MVERRLTVLVGALALWSAAVTGKLASIQLVHHQEYARKARAHQEIKRTLPAPRGTIYDRNGQPLAMSLPTQSVTVNPLKLPDLGVAADLLEQVLHMQGSGLYDKLKQACDRGRGYFVVKREITPEEAESVRALPDWVELETSSQRHYPKGTLAAHVLGGVDYSERGNAGIEKALDDELHGKPGQEMLLTDVKRRGIASQQSNQPKPGIPITLTIDERVQFAAERQLAAAVTAKGAVSGSVVVMNPQTGDVLALASYPTFDPNEPPKTTHDPERENHASSVPFEPGSVFKVITISAALETTDLRPGSLIDCGRGTITLFGRTIHEAEGRGYGVIPVAQVLAHSSNVGAIRIGMRVGQQNLYNYVRSFGFGQYTGIPLPGESRGTLRRLPQWSSTSLASISFGQEISVTTVQLAQAISVIANGGLLVRPRLVAKEGGQPVPLQQPVRALKPETAFTMRQMMEGVVMPGGTGYPEARLAGYSVAGKTGTALIFDFSGRRYTHNYNATFAGMAPLTNPSIVVVVTLNGTHGDLGYGGRAAAPVFNAVASEALRILDVPRDLPDQPAKTLVASREESSDDGAIAGFGPPPDILPDAQDDDRPAAPAGTVAALGPTVPNFQGMTMRDVLAQAASQGLTVLPNGSGVARVQYPAPGAVLRRGERIRVRFER